MSDIDRQSESIEKSERINNQLDQLIVWSIDFIESSMSEEEIKREYLGQLEELTSLQDYIGSCLIFHLKEHNAKGINSFDKIEFESIKNSISPMSIGKEDLINIQYQLQGGEDGNYNLETALEDDYLYGKVGSGYEVLRKCLKIYDLLGEQIQKIFNLLSS